MRKNSRNHKKGFVSWVKKNKVKIIVGGVAIVIIIGGVIIYKRKRNPYAKVGTTVEKDLLAKTVEEAIVEVEKVKQIIQPETIELVGEKLTATELGRIMHCSPQQINKRIVEKGLALRMPQGDYMLTDIGQMFGEQVTKCTKAGYCFENIEWDKSILNIIFDENEIVEAQEKTERIRELLEKWSA